MKFSNHNVKSEIQSLDRIRFNYYVIRKFNRISQMEGIEFLLHCSRLSLFNRQEVIDHLKKEHFLRMVRLHPLTRTIPVHRVLNYWNTVEFQSN